MNSFALWQRKDVELKKTRNKRLLILLAAAVIALAALIFTIVSLSGRIEVDTLTVSEMSTLISKAEGEGSLVPIMRYAQKSICDASIQMFAARTGDAVKKGDIVAYLDSDYTDMYLSLLEQKGEAELSLIAGNEGAQEIYNAIEAQINGLLSNNEACRCMFIYADVTGTVCRFKVNDGDVISVGEELFEIVDDSVYMIEFSLEEWAEPLFYGDEVDLYDKNGKELSFDAKVVKIDGLNYTLTAKDCTKYYDGADKLFYKFDYGSAEGYVLPLSSVVSEGEESYVYTVKGAKAVKTKVEILLSNKENCCVKGLEEKQKVILEPQTVTEGAKIKVSDK